MNRAALPVNGDRLLFPQSKAFGSRKSSLSPFTCCAAASLTLFTTACGSGIGIISETIDPTPFEATVLATANGVSPAPSFADERGGGIFIASQAVVRVRADGSTLPVQSHPGNAVKPGTASTAWPLGPFSALIATSTGLFVAESGWLVAPPWQSLLSADGMVGTALDKNGVAWLAHERGLFRLEGGKLFELASQGAPLTGINALAVAPGPRGSESVWFSISNKLQYAERQSTADYLIYDSGLSAEDTRGGLLALAGLQPSSTAPGELLAITAQRVLWRYAYGTWRRYPLTFSSQRLFSAGRFAWLQAKDYFWRYDADEAKWGQAEGIAPGTQLQAVDAAGTAWAGDGATLKAISDGWVPRVSGLFQNEQLYGTESVITALIPTAAQPQALHYRIDDGENQPLAVDSALPGEGLQKGQRVFLLGGSDAAGPRPLSMSAYEDGPHTLQVTAAFSDGATRTRRLHFDLNAGLTGTVGWATDIEPIFRARCANCHQQDGPGRELVGYEAWKKDSALIAAAVRDRRMPADGPLDPVFIARIVRWVNGGMLP